LLVESSGDPCNGGSFVRQAAGVVDFSPEGGVYADNLQCDWVIFCNSGAPQITFTEMNVEAGYDIVTVFDGIIEDGYGIGPEGQLGELSGQNTGEFVGSGNTVSIEFVTDGSAGGAGFEFDFVCNSAGGGGH
jgi:hypothetical protein